MKILTPAEIYELLPDRLNTLAEARGFTVGFELCQEMARSEPYEARKAEFCRSCAYPDRADALGAQVLEQAARIAELEKEDENVVSSINSSIEFLRSSERAEHHLRIAAESRLADYGRSCRCDGCAMSFQAECPRVSEQIALEAAEERGARAFADWCDNDAPCGGMEWTDEEGDHPIDLEELIDRWLADRAAKEG
jgi:hypothetical protein